MDDIRKAKENLPCPECRALVEITLGQIADETAVKCYKCGNSFKLIDSGGKAKKTIRDFNDSMRKLEDSLKRFGR